MPPPASMPGTPVSVAIVTLQSPFPTLLTLWEENSTISAPDRHIWFNPNGAEPTKLSEPAQWSTFGTESPASFTSKITKDNEAQDVVLQMTFNPGAAGAGAENIGYQLTATGNPIVKSTSAPFIKGQANGPAESTNVKITSTGGPVGSQQPQTTLESVPTSLGTSPTLSSPSSSSSANTATPTTTSDNSRNDRAGLSGGAVAGVAIGCLLAGAFLAGVLAWLCLRRRKFRNGTRNSEASTVALMPREKGPIAKTVSIASGSPIASALENGLPQPLEDQAISGEISKIGNLIKNHVQSYYHGRAVSPGLIDYDDIHALGENLPISVGTLSTLLNNSATREIALRFCIAWVVTSRIQLNDTTNTTFLPPEVAKSIQSMNFDNGQQPSRVRSLLFGKWRALTAELLQPTYVQNPFSAADGRTRNVKAAATLLDGVLRPFADSRMEDGSRSRNLEEILKRSAQFAFTLFSQPTSWKFDWKNEPNAPLGSLCIFPALVQVADENGEPLRSPRPFSEAVIRPLDD